jgi:hypothetical protein
VGGGGGKLDGGVSVLELFDFLLVFSLLFLSFVPSVFFVRFDFRLSEEKLNFTKKSELLMVYIPTGASDLRGERGSSSSSLASIKMIRLI